MSGWPSTTREVDHSEVMRLKAEAAPYADRLLQMDDLLPFHPTVDAPEDSPAVERDHNVERPFEFAWKGELTTFKVNRWIPGYRRREAAMGGEGSSSKAAGGKDGE